MNHELTVKIKTILVILAIDIRTLLLVKTNEFAGSEAKTDEGWWGPGLVSTSFARIKDRRFRIVHGDKLGTSKRSWSVKTCCEGA